MADPIDRYAGQDVTPALLRDEATRLDETPATGQASWAMGEAAALHGLAADALATLEAERDAAVARLAEVAVIVEAEAGATPEQIVAETQMLRSRWAEACECMAEADEALAAAVARADGLEAKVHEWQSAWRGALARAEQAETALADLVATWQPVMSRAVTSWRQVVRKARRRLDVPAADTPSEDGSDG